MPQSLSQASFRTPQDQQQPLSSQWPSFSKHPYLTPDGAEVSLTVAAGPSVSVNLIFGLPFIEGTRMDVDFNDNVAVCRGISCPPFPIEKKRARVHVPSTEDAKVHVSGNPDFTSFLEDLATLDATIASVYATASTPSPMKRTRFADEPSLESDLDDKIPPGIPPVQAESSNDWGLGALAHNVE